MQKVVGLIAFFVAFFLTQDIIRNAWGQTGGLTGDYRDAFVGGAIL
jgi:hypothetical protein